MPIKGARRPTASRVRATMKIELTKRLRSFVRELSAKAHERELRRVLTPLATSFEQWRLNKRSTRDLLKEIDRLAFPRRRLAERYETASIAPMLVAAAIVTGLLRIDEVPDEVVRALDKAIAYYRKGLA